MELTLIDPFRAEIDAIVAEIEGNLA